MDFAARVVVTPALESCSRTFAPEGVAVRVIPFNDIAADATWQLNQSVHYGASFSLPSLKILLTSTAGSGYLLDVVDGCPSEVVLVSVSEDGTHQSSVRVGLQSSRYRIRSYSTIQSCCLGDCCFNTGTIASTERLEFACPVIWCEKR